MNVFRVVWWVGPLFQVPPPYPQQIFLHLTLPHNTPIMLYIHGIPSLVLLSLRQFSKQLMGNK